MAPIFLGWNMEGFFFIMRANIGATNKPKRKSISSGYIIPKIIFNKKKCQN